MSVNLRKIEITGTVYKTYQILKDLGLHVSSVVFCTNAVGPDAAVTVLKKMTII